MYLRCTDTGSLPLSHDIDPTVSLYLKLFSHLKTVFAELLLGAPSSSFHEEALYKMFYYRNGLNTSSLNFCSHI